MNGSTEQRREEGHFKLSHPDERKNKESNSEKSRVNGLYCHLCDHAEASAA